MQVRLRTDRLQALLAASRLSQNHWAIRLGLSRGHWSEIVNGRHPFPSAKTRQRMLEVFGVALDELFEVVPGPSGDAAFRAALQERYLIDQELAQGWMGTVYLARDLAHGRTVAIKMLSPEAVCGIGVDAFRQEIAATARLQHPHILPLYESGVADGHPYFVMPWIRGGSLRDRIRREGRLTPRVAAGVLRGVAAALEYAHGERILHCDVKPANILLHGDHAYVMDFGISRVLHAEASEWRARRELDSGAGTPAYVSPEQASGDADVDERADIYSLGCVAFEMLTGRPPFEGETTDAIVARRFSTTPPSVRDHVPDLPASVDGAVRRSMSLRREERPPTPGEFAASFTAAATGALLAAPPTIQPPTTPPHARRESRLMARTGTTFRQALRRLVFERRYALAVMFILGIGIGPVAAIFSIVQRVWLEPLDYVAPERLGLIRFNLGNIQHHPGLAPDEIRDLQQSQGIFTTVAATGRGSEVSLGTPDRLQPLSQMATTPALFRMLGVKPVLGRLFTADDSSASPAPVILGYDSWRKEFGGDSSVVDRTILLNGQSSQVVGVLPRSFTLAFGRGVPRSYDVYVPLQLPPSRNFWAFPTLVRLAPGETFDQASSRLEALAQDLTTRYPEVYADGHLRFELVPLTDDVLQATRPALRAALAGVLLLLLIAVANATAMVVARLTVRTRDFAIRTAIGAGRRDLLRDVLAESALLSAGGALVGIGVAAAAIMGARALIPHTVPRWDHVGLGWGLLLYCTVLAAVGLALVGLIPMWRANATRPWEVLRSGSVQGGKAEGARSRLLLVGAQVALTVVLAFAAVQLVRSAASLGRVDLGFDPDLLTFRVPLDFGVFRQPQAQAEAYQRVRERLAQVAGVEAVGAVSHLPLSGATLTDGYSSDLSASASFDKTVANYYSVLPGYFSAMRIPVIRGRDFTDDEDRTGQSVIVVDESLARTAFPGQDPIGKTLKLGWGIPDSRIVGVVASTRAIEVGRVVRPQIYSPYGTFQWPPLIFTVRAAGDPMRLVPAMQSAVAELGLGRAPSGFAPLRSNVVAATSTLHSVTGLVTGLALSAALLSAVGLYVVMAFLVHQRRRSTAIRSALGASRRRLIGEYARTSAWVVAVALPLGLALAAGIAPLFASLTYGVAPRDGGSLAMAAVIAACTGLAGSVVPVRRAADADPTMVLRSE